MKKISVRLSFLKFNTRLAFRILSYVQCELYDIGNTIKWPYVRVLVWKKLFFNVRRLMKYVPTAGARKTGKNTLSMIANLCSSFFFFLLSARE